MIITGRGTLAFGVLVLTAAMAGALAWIEPPVGAQTLPARLGDRDFWAIATDFSEPDGTFHSENLVSNEIRFQTIVPDLVERTRPGRAYVGVGSEQNFTYIDAVRPAIAFIVDIRRGNLDLHLAYKALFELSADRADFVSRLFSRPRPAGLTERSTVAEMFAAYDTVVPSQELFEANLKAIFDHLTTRHGFALSDGDREGIRFVYGAWYVDGPDIRYSLNGGRGGSSFPTYADLMTATDGAGRHRSYLASEESFKFLKDLEGRNLVVPVVGNFGGPKALRAVAGWLRQHDAVVSAFYTSNVEQYLQRDGLWQRFCESAATMPFDRSSTLIRSMRGGFAGFRVGGGGFILQLLPAAAEFSSC
jgi:hypothetical protein